jgi:hypothetical protein
MKRVYSRLGLLLILCSLLMPTLSVTWIPEVKGAEQDPWQEIAENPEENGNFTLETSSRKLPENGIWVAFLIDYRWFSIRLLYDNASKTYSVYAKELFVGDSMTDKGELVAENMRGPTVSSDGTYNPLEILPLFEMREYYNLVIVYYDGVEVLVVAAENPLSSVIKVLSPQNTTYNVAEVPLECKLNSIFYTTKYSLDGQENQTFIGSTVLTGLSDGPHSIVVYAESPLDNSSASETIYFTVASARGISILSPQNKTYSTADIPLTLTKNETCYYTAYSLDGQLHTDTENTILTGLSEGAHQLTVYANYTNSHMGESATVWFSVDTTPPKITDIHQPQISTINRTLEAGVEATVTESVSEEATMKYSDDNGTGVTAETTELEEDVCNSDTPAFPNGTNVTDTHIAEDETENIITTKEQYGHQKQCKVLQDFPSWIIPPLLLIVTASALVVRKRISTKVFTKIYNRVHQLLT